MAGEAVEKEARVIVHMDRMSEWTVDRMLFGRFLEHHDQDVYPGIYEQFVVNTSFAEWYRKGDDSLSPVPEMRPWLVFRDIEETEGLAYPWEPAGAESGAAYQPTPDSVNSGTAQQVSRTRDTVEQVGIKQRIGLPDYRTDTYRLRFHAKSGLGHGNVEVQFRDPKTGDVFDSHRFSLSADWRTFKGTLSLQGQRSARRHRDRRGVYEIAFLLQGDGPLRIDQVTLFPSDAVDGRWNPETIENLRDAGVTAVRWPGGNFASGYHWKDGVGPLDQRPTTRNHAWGGLEPHHVGTDEILAYCELLGMTPVICIGFDYVSVQEAAKWVEYVNGCPRTTPYGCLRARNGRYEPYGVKIWQVGNEVYGDYQIGHTDAEDYATRYLDYYHAMKRVDPTIEVMVMGRDPGYQCNDNNAWNKTLFEVIGDRMDYLDIHRYIRGIRRREALARWDPTHLAEVYIAYPTQYERVVIDSIRELTRPGQFALPVKLAITEWAQYLSLEDPRLPHRWSHANAVFHAGMLNVFLRNSDFVRISCTHDFSSIAHNHRSVPPSPRNQVNRLYGDAAAGRRILETTLRSDTFDMTGPIPQMETIGAIPFLDVVALTDEGQDEPVLLVVNRALEADYYLTVQLDGGILYTSMTITRFTAANDPLAPQTWSAPVRTSIRTERKMLEDREFSLRIPACSVVRVVLDRTASCF